MTSTATQLDQALRPAADARTAATAIRLPVRAALYVLLVFSALPDAMIPPMLEGLFVTRYGVSAGAAHWFMAVNLVGAAMAVPLLLHLRKLLSPAALLAVAAIANGVLLAVLAFPIGFGASLGLRLVEGAVDLLVLAVLFDLIVKSGPPTTRGRRLGLAGGVLMLSIGAGLALGGVIGKDQPALVFIVGAAACGAVALVTLAAGNVINSVVTSCPAAHVDVNRPRQGRQLWPAMAMALSDRAVAGLFTATIPLYFVSQMDFSTAQAGGLLGLTMLVMAIGSWPAGVLSDRLGHLRVRVAAALLYAGAVAAVAGAASMSTAALVLVMIAIGFFGAALMPTSLALASRCGRGSVAMGALHAAGNVGFFAGIVGSGLLLEAVEPTASAEMAFLTVIVALAVLHVAVTIVTTLALLRRSHRRPAPIAHSAV